MKDIFRDPRELAKGRCAKKQAEAVRSKDICYSKFVFDTWVDGKWSKDATTEQCEGIVNQFLTYIKGTSACSRSKCGGKDAQFVVVDVHKGKNTVCLSLAPCIII
jgi:hypothetical protein